MKNLSQPEALVIRGNDLAPHHGSVVPCVPLTFFDGPVGAKVACPRTVEEWPHVAEGVLVPNVWLPCDDAAAGVQLLDRGLGVHSFASIGAVTFQQSVANWTGFWAGLIATSGTGFRALVSTVYDPLMPLFGTFDAQITSTGGPRTIYTVCSGVLIQIDVSGRISLVITGSTTVVGTFDYRHATSVYPFAFFWDPTGPSPIFIVATNKEQVQVTAGSGVGGVVGIQGDSAKGFGGISSSSPVAKVTRHALWRGAPAITMGNYGGAPGARAGAKALTAARKWAMAY